MHRALPVSNKILSKRWEESNHRIHTEKLKNMQARVNSGQPVQFAHLKVKAKRDQILEDRFTEIERENRILLEKMSSIMKKRQNKDSGAPAKSLNKVARKEQMRKITIDNQALLKRLQDKNPCYNTHHWEEERKKTEKRLKNLCEYPYALGRDMSTPATQKKPRKLSPINRTTVFKKGIAIGVKHFVVEIQRNKKNLVIYMNDVESPDSYSLKLPLKEAQELMGNSFNYDKIVAMLEMDNGEIVLIDPREKDDTNNNTEPVSKQNPRYEPANTGNFQYKKPKINESDVARSYDFSEDKGKKEQKMKAVKNMDANDFENEEFEDEEEEGKYQEYEEKEVEKFGRSKSNDRKFEDKEESEEENYEEQEENVEKNMEDEGLYEKNDVEANGSNEKIDEYEGEPNEVGKNEEHEEERVESSKSLKNGNLEITESHENIHEKSKDSEKHEKSEKFPDNDAENLKISEDEGLLNDELKEQDSKALAESQLELYEGEKKDLLSYDGENFPNIREKSPTPHELSISQGEISNPLSSSPDPANIPKVVPIDSDPAKPASADSKPEDSSKD